MEFLRILEKLRIPVLNEFMLGITYLGDEIAFLVVALILFWCVDKRKGYFILTVGFVGTIFNQFMKLAFRIPRPWVQDPEFTILEQAKEAASGYSFPSGHSQNSVGTFGGIAAVTKNKIIRILSIAVCILVPFSRMYIGVHTPSDVLVGAAMAVTIIILMRPLIFGNDGKRIPLVLAGMTVLAAAYLCFVEFYPFPLDIDPHNLESGVKNAYTLAGSLVGLIIVYFVDEKYLHFDTEAVWWIQIIKVALGLLAVLVIKSGLKPPIDALCGGHMIGRAIRYFLIVIMAGIIWPLSFKRLNKLSRK